MSGVHLLSRPAPNAAAPKSGDEPLLVVCLDIVKDLLSRFGGELTSSRDELLHVLLPLLEYPVESIRKRASLTLGVLVRLALSTLVLCPITWSHLLVSVVRFVTSTTICSSS